MHVKYILVLLCLCLLSGVCLAAEPATRPGQDNLQLTQQDGNLTGSFTYQLIVGQFYEWNTDPTAVPGILNQLASRDGVKTRVEFKAIALDDPRIFRNPVLIMTGNRAFVLAEPEIQNLRRYLTGGGFLYVDDCGGADWSLRRMVSKVLPEANLVELPPEHPIFKRPYDLPGAPKVVDLYRGPAKAFGVTLAGRLAVVYTYDTDIPCAWECYPDGSFVHVIDPQKREVAIRFGVNVLDYALRQHLTDAGCHGGRSSAAMSPPGATLTRTGEGVERATTTAPASQLAPSLADAPNAHGMPAVGPLPPPSCRPQAYSLGGAERATTSAPAALISEPKLPAPTLLPPEMVRNYPMRRQLPCNYISAMAADANAVWFGGFAFMPGEDEGLARYDKAAKTWKVFMDAEGALSEEINCLALDGPKVLVGADTWKWTKGLATFNPADGNWTTLNTQQGLPHDRVVGIARDGNDTWIACRQGLAVLHAGSERAETISSPAFSNDSAFMIGVMADTRYVWANHFTVADNGQGGSVTRLDKRTGQWQSLAQVTPLLPRHALDMTQGGGSAWFLSPDAGAVHLVRFDYEGGQFSQWPDARDVNLSAAACIAADETHVFIGTKDDGIYAFPIAGGPPTHYEMPAPLPKGQVRKMLADDNCLWASIQIAGGLWRLDLGTGRWEHIPVREGTPASHVLSLCTAGATLYVGTLAGGPWAYNIRQGKWQNLNIELIQQGHPYAYLGEHDAIKWDNIYSIAPLDGRVYMGTNHGLIVHDPTSTPTGFGVIGPNKVICKGLAVADGLVWFADATGGLWAYDPNQHGLREDKKWSLNSPTSAMCLWEDSFYFATDKGVFSYNPQAKLGGAKDAVAPNPSPLAGEGGPKGRVRGQASATTSSPASEPSSFPSQASLQGAAGASGPGGAPNAADVLSGEFYSLWPTTAGLWIAGSSGLWRIKAPDEEPQFIASTGQLGRVNCVTVAEGMIFVGTSNGLLVLNRQGQVKALYDASSGLGASSIAAVAATPGRIWLGTLGEGITVVEMAAFEQK